MDINNIRQAISSTRFRITDHADEETAADGLKLQDVLESVQSGEVIEDYPADYPLPSCLIYGQTGAGEHVHSVWAYNEHTAGAVLITVYRPATDRWIDWRTRKH